MGVSSAAEEYVPEPLPQTLKWTPWSADASNIPFRSPEKNVGPGERRLALQLEFTKNTNGLQSYDLLDPRDGSRWEVKNVDRDGKFRPNKAGREQAMSLLRRVKDA